MTQIWHQSYVKDFKRQFGWGYKEVIYEGTGGLVMGYRSPREHVAGLRDFVIGKLSADPEWLSRESAILCREIDATTAFIDEKRKGPFPDYANDDLVKILEKFISHNISFGPRFIIAFWFPIHMEQYPEKAKYERAIAAAVLARDRVEKIGPIADSFARDLATEVLQRAGSPATYSKFVTCEELLNYLRKGTRISRDVLEKRREYFLVTNEGVLLESLSSYVGRKGYIIPIEEVSEAIEVIRGSVAYPGVARGIVKIVKTKETLQKFQDVEILVTAMTTPDFVPILKKAKGFITDEGGITCHAAIAARELKKPCIIGTKVATKVLKDDDLVEIDGDNGIVRILKK